MTVERRSIVFADPADAYRFEAGAEIVFVGRVRWWRRLWRWLTRWKPTVLVVTDVRDWEVTVRMRHES